MKYSIYYIGLLLCSPLLLLGQIDTTNCNPDEGLTVADYTAQFYYGATTDAYSNINRTNVTIGQPVVGSAQSQTTTAGFGYWSAFISPPQTPLVMATQGDFPDRVEVQWEMDPLSPDASEGFTITRDGSYLAEVDPGIAQFIDFNVQAGEPYEYGVIPKNQFGPGNEGTDVGFVNPNGVVLGKVTTQNNNPVQGAVITLTPTVGRSMYFDGNGANICLSHHPALHTDMFTASAWVKLGDGNDRSGILDLGSDLKHNFYLLSTPSSLGKGVVAGVGDSTTVYEVTHEFESAPDDWHQVTAVYGGGTLLLYVDGAFVGATQGAIAMDDATYTIGSRRDQTGFLNGWVDDIRIFNRLLPQSEIILTQNTTVSKNTEGLIAYWKFDEGRGRKAFDLSDNGMDAFINSAAFSEDTPELLNAGITNEDGFYAIEGVNYSTVQSFTARPQIDFYSNYALEFNAAYEAYATLTDYDLADSATITLIVQPFDLQSRQTLLSKGNGDFEFFIDSAQYKLTINGETHPLGTPSDTGYQHLTFLLDGGTGEVRFYQENADVVSLDYASLTGDWPGTPWMLGAKDATMPKHFYTGLIDEVAFYDLLLPDTTRELIASRFGSGGTDTGYDGLEVYFPLNEGQGAELLDFGAAMTGAGTAFETFFSTITRVQETTPHEFEPNARVVNINNTNSAVNNVDFTDVSTVPISGVVRFQNTFCFVDQVEILVNGASHVPPIYTDEDGRFVGDFEPGADVMLTPVLGDPGTDEAHTFAPAFYEVRNLNASVAGVLFQDLTTRTIEGQLAGGPDSCRALVFEPEMEAKIELTSLAYNGNAPCYSREFIVDADNDGKYKFENLPAIPYTVNMKNHSDAPINTYFGDLGGENSDVTLLQADTVDFIYRSAPVVDLTGNWSENECEPPVIVMYQAAKHKATIKVVEPYYQGETCPLEEAEIIIKNAIADSVQLDTVMVDGELKYDFFVGDPIFNGIYKKNLEVTAKVESRQSAPNTLTALVMGKRQRDATFTSTSPEIPFLVLHDPPGDGSYAYIEEDNTHCFEMAFEMVEETNINNKLSLKKGSLNSVTTGLGVATTTVIEQLDDQVWEYSYSGVDGYSETTTGCVTATETFQTSAEDDVVGDQGGDVFVGAAMNMVYGVVDVLYYDGCEVKDSTDLVVSPEGFKTTFYYSEYQIANDVIPNLLNELQDTASAQSWQAILDDNNSRKVEAVFEENISFDAGTIYESETTERTTSSTSFSYKDETVNEFYTNLGISINGFGITNENLYSVRILEAGSENETEDVSRTVKYVLKDDDPGDNYTINLKRDQVYGTPVFDVVAGETMCPWESNTVNRQEVSLAIDPTIQTGVGSNQAAVFNLTLGNTSQTSQTMAYRMGEVPGSNPNGALIDIIGISENTQDIQVPAFESEQFTMTIDRGPIEYTYLDMQIAAFSGCEYDRALQLGYAPGTQPILPLDGYAIAAGESTIPDSRFYKDVELDVYFAEPCSEIDISQLQNDVIIPTSNPLIAVNMFDYDLDNPVFKEVRLQYRYTEGSGAWINIIDPLPKEELGDLFTTRFWDTEPLPDGLYELRAVAICFSSSSLPGISTIREVRIEREPPQVLGVPEPADGVLSPGDEISIRFTKRIDCGQIFYADILGNNTIGLYDATQDILKDAIVTCSEDQLFLVPNVPAGEIENRNLRVRVENVKDLVGNSLQEPVVWEFFVNRSALYWEGGDIEEVVDEGTSFSVTRKIRNQGGFITNFSLDNIPSWVTVSPLSGSVAPGDAETITFEFDNDLVSAEYLQTIIMNTTDGDEPLELDIRVTCPPPVWDVDPMDWTYSMTMTVQLNIEDSLSTDNLDLIGAFVGSELRGVAEVEYVPEVQKYLAFLTIYSNELVGETVTFRIWDAKECTLYGSTDESFDFVADDLIGSPISPQVIHTNNLLLRKIPIFAGWNWISYNLELPDPSINTALNSLTRPEDATIKGQTSFSQYFNTGGVWAGSLTALSHLTMYQYRGTTFDSLAILGHPVDPGTTSIPLSAGWNWIGYLPQQGLPVNQALASLSPLNGDIIKSQAGFAQYVAGVGWVGNLDFMSSPNGYLINLGEAGTLTYPESFNGPNEEAFRGNDGIEARSASQWEVDPHGYEHSMNLIAVVTDAETGNLLHEGDEVGAFINGEVRGSAQPIYVEAADAYLLFMTVYGNAEGGTVTFKYYDGTDGEIKAVEESFVFIANDILGTVNLPEPLTLQSVTATESLSGSAPRFELFPNPAKERVYLSFDAPAAAEIIVVVSDATGREVARIGTEAAAGGNLLEWRPNNLAAGLYFVTLHGNGPVQSAKLNLRP
ncbi:LamG-like jellyroll fold domain-containing protein [Phaeodactylibacter xiamenensis]|uniref:LamG-like jellyroll fold domain-containing protein n=1 Tax=Phaeodactylibacter xiamenensis TaxID=1524460 RepID=UPI003CCBAA75